MAGVLNAERSLIAAGMETMFIHGLWVVQQVWGMVKLDVQNAIFVKEHLLCQTYVQDQ